MNFKLKYEWRLCIITLIAAVLPVHETLHILSWNLPSHAVTLAGLWWGVRWCSSETWISSRVLPWSCQVVVAVVVVLTCNNNFMLISECSTKNQTISLTSGSRTTLTPVANCSVLELSFVQLPATLVGYSITSDARWQTGSIINTS